MVVSDEFAVAHHQQGQVNVATVDVVKCRNCNTLLNPKKDYLYTAEEQRKINANEKRRFENDERVARNWGLWGFLIGAPFGFAVIVENGGSITAALIGSLIGGGLLGFFIWIIKIPKKATTTFTPPR